MTWEWKVSSSSDLNFNKDIKIGNQNKNKKSVSPLNIKKVSSRELTENQKKIQRSAKKLVDLLVEKEEKSSKSIDKKIKTEKTKIKNLILSDEIAMESTGEKALDKPTDEKIREDRNSNLRLARANRLIAQCEKRALETVRDKSGMEYGRIVEKNNEIEGYSNAIREITK